MQSFSKNNVVTLCGQVACKPVLDHIINNIEFYKFFLNIKRQSQRIDTLTVIAPKDLAINVNEGEFCKVLGQFRSYNNKNATGKKLELFVFAKEMGQADDGVYINTADMIGFICKSVIFRVTPKGKQISDLLVALNRGNFKSDYIPAIAWGENASAASKLKIGDNVKLSGRIQSRGYSKVINNEKVEMTAYEMSVNQIEKIEK